MISSLIELFPSSNVLNVRLPIWVFNEKEEKELASYYPELDLIFLPPLDKIINGDLFTRLNKFGFNKEDLKAYQFVNEVPHALLNQSGVGIQLVLLEEFQLEEFIKIKDILSNSKQITDETIESLRYSWNTLYKLDTDKKILFTRSVEVHEAFASFCLYKISDIMFKGKRDIIGKIIEEDLKQRDKELGNGKMFQFWKKLLWIEKEFGIKTAFDSIKLALNTSPFAISYLHRFNKLPAEINPRARFEMICRDLEKHGGKAKEFISEVNSQAAIKIKEDVKKIETAKWLRLMLGDEKLLLLGPSYLITYNLKKQISENNIMDTTYRFTPLIIKEALPGYWKEFKKGETKRQVRHPVKGDLTLEIMEEVAYTERISSALFVTFMLSVLKDQFLAGEIHCLKRSFDWCLTKRVKTYSNGWDKFRERKCSECVYYRLVNNLKSGKEILVSF